MYILKYIKNTNIYMYMSVYTFMCAFSNNQRRGNEFERE